jgi:hypothetical protein
MSNKPARGPGISWCHVTSKKLSAALVSIHHEVQAIVGAFEVE